MDNSITLYICMFVLYTNLYICVACSPQPYRFTSAHFGKGSIGMQHGCEMDVSFVITNTIRRKLILASF